MCSYPHGYAACYLQYSSTRYLVVINTNSTINNMPLIPYLVRRAACPTRTFICNVSSRGTAPARCVMTSGPQPTRTQNLRSSRILQRPRTLISTMFAEGEVPAADGAVAEGKPADAAAAAGGGDGGVKDEEPKKPISKLELAQIAKQEEIERLRSKEKFITAPTGVYAYM